jgi:hypothetical protein
MLLSKHFDKKKKLMGLHTRPTVLVGSFFQIYKIIFILLKNLRTFLFFRNKRNTL